MSGIFSTEVCRKTCRHVQMNMLAEQIGPSAKHTSSTEDLCAERRKSECLLNGRYVESGTYMCLHTSNSYLAHPMVSDVRATCHR